MHISLIRGGVPLPRVISDGVIIPVFDAQVPLHRFAEVQFLSLVLSTSLRSPCHLTDGVVDVLVAKLLSCLIDMRCLLFHREQFQGVGDVEGIVLIQLQVLANLCHSLVGISFCFLGLLPCLFADL